MGGCPHAPDARFGRVPCLRTDRHRRGVLLGSQRLRRNRGWNHRPPLLAHSGRWGSELRRDRARMAVHVRARPDRGGLVLGRKRRWTTRRWDQGQSEQSRRGVRGILFRAISAGYAHSCGVSVDGTAYCWGRNDHGQVGDGTFKHSSVPVPVAGDVKFASISAGIHHTCGVAESGIAYRWGLNESGQIGDDSTIDRGVPTVVWAP